MHDKDTYTLARAFYKVENAAKHFDSILPSIDPRCTAYGQFKGYVAKLRWILNDVVVRLEPGTRDIFKAEIHTWETLAFDDAESEMVLLDQDKRAIVADMIKALRKGELVLEEGPNYKQLYEEMKEQNEKLRAKYERLKRSKNIMV